MISIIFFVFPTSYCSVDAFDNFVFSLSFIVFCTSCVSMCLTLRFALQLERKIKQENEQKNQNDLGGIYQTWIRTEKRWYTCRFDEQNSSICHDIWPGNMTSTKRSLEKLRCNVSNGMRNIWENPVRQYKKYGSKPVRVTHWRPIKTKKVYHRKDD